MRYIIAAIVGLAILAFSSPVFADDHTWQRPTECADEDRQISGNRSTPCKYVIPTVEEVEYEVRMVYPYCWEVLYFYAPGVKPLPAGFYIGGVEMRLFETSGSTRPRGYVVNDPYWPEYDRFIVREGGFGREGRFAYLGSRWGLGDFVPTNSPTFNEQRNDFPYVRLSFSITGSGQLPWTNAMLYPDATNTGELVNACLALVKQQKEDEEHAAELARQEAAEAARIVAERDAAAKEEEQAQREADTQARIAEQELAAANERRLAIARAEEIRTQTLIDEIALQEVLTAILNDIVRIRLAGQDDRARITNEYLNRARDASADFEVETSEIESRVQEYLDFNAALLVEIAEYQLSIQNRLDRLRASIEEQRAEIDRLEAGAREIAVPVEEQGESVDGRDEDESQ